MKIYNIVFSFKELTQAMGTFMAESEEAAVSNLKSQLEGQVEDLTIDSVEEVAHNVEISDIAEETNTTIN